MSIESVLSSNYLIFCRPLLLLPSIFPSIKLFSKESALHIRWPKLEFPLQHQSFQWIFRTDFLWDGLVGSPCCPRDSQESSSAQFKGINSLSLCLLYGPALRTVHNYWEDHSLDYIDLDWQSNVSVFNTLPRFVTDFLPRSNHLLISWLQSPSAVILESQKRKSDTTSTFSLLFAMK